MNKNNLRDGDGPGSHRSGFVAVVGRPNVGKSTLVNSLVGKKVAIVARTPQTTRNRIAGIVSGDDFQMVLLDLPGFQKPRDLLTERMQATVNSTLKEVDLILFMLSAASRIGAGDRYVAAAAFVTATPVIIAVNKIDLVSGEQLLPQIKLAGELWDFQELFPVSAKRGWGLDELKQSMISRMPAGPRYFPPGAVTDQPEKVIVSELIREQAVRLTREEIPHAVAVEVTSIQPGEKRGLVDISAVIMVERESQKGILIGLKGSMIREIGSRARKEIEPLLGSRIFLELTVKVKKKWRDDGRILGQLDI